MSSSDVSARYDGGFPAAGMRRLLGRDRELRIVDQHLEEARARRPSWLLLRGEPGIGKTALLDAVVDSATEWTVLRVAGVETEQALDLAGLVALLGSVRSSIRELDPRQTGVLDGVLVSGEPAPPLEVGVATLHLLAHLAGEAPVLVVVDDVQWVDEATLAALRFGFRRLGPERVALVGATRDPELRLWPDQPTLEIRGLDRDAAADLFDQMGGAVSEVVAECHERSGGNPLALRRICQGLSWEQREGIAPLPTVLPVGVDLTSRLAAEVADLPERPRGALRVAAVAGRLHLAALRRALDVIGLGLEDLSGPEDAGLIRLESLGVEFSHPLLREAAAAGTPAEIRSVHSALAEVAEGERRAWHLAAASTGADADADQAIEALTEVAHRAERHGAHAAAAVAWTRVAELCAEPTARAEHLLAAGSAWTWVDVPQRAEPLLRAALDGATSEVRTRIVWVLGEVLAWSTSVDEAVRTMRSEAERLLPVDEESAALLLAGAAGFLGLRGDVRGGSELAWQAERLGAGADPVVEFTTRLMVTHLEVLGGTDPADLRDRRLELDGIRSMVVPGAGPDLLELAQLLAFDDLSLERWREAGELFDRIAAVARSDAQVSVLNFASAMRAEILWRQGRWSDARAWAMEDVTHFEAVGGQAGAFGHAVFARVEAALGLGDQAGGRAATARARGEEIEMEVLAAWGHHAEALCDLASNRPESAAAHLDVIWQLCRSGGFECPGPLWWQGDLLDALVSLDRLDEARRLTDWLGRTARSDATWPRAVLARAAGLLDGEVDEARWSVQLLDDLGAPFESARSRLALAGLLDGVERVAVLEEAVDGFGRLGARPWETRARRLLGESAGSESAPALAAMLTRAELRVALVVGRGATNREAAAELALSQKTVDAHLQSIYRKLGVRSRTELALRVAAETGS